MTLHSPLHPVFPIACLAFALFQLVVVALLELFVAYGKPVRERLISRWVLGGLVSFLMSLSDLFADKRYRNMSIGDRMEAQTLGIETRAGNVMISVVPVCAVMRDRDGTHARGYGPYFYRNSDGWRHNRFYGLLADYWISDLGQTPVFVPDHDRALLRGMRPVADLPDDPEWFAAASPASIARLSNPRGWA
jgi:hypothetical protein